ncbi:MAG TPA: patatin-like phospholipase family protein [Bryobacteraceae bacterium]|nr:patatin-like phospholipase family protein [Bryobacteraceae bacterium]
MATTERTALVLSAGGMFGAWQAGVWEGLCDIFDPEIIVGASVGSLNGWLIACGCSGPDLAQRWVEAGRLAHIRWRWPRRISDGFLDPTDLEQWIQESCTARIPRRRFGVVLTDTRRFRPTLFEWPSVEWTHLAASCGVPLFLRQQIIGGRMYSDGGFIDPLPLDAAVSMGATRIVTVDVMKRRPWLLERGVRIVQAATGYRRTQPSNIALVDISPSHRLGSARDSMYWSAENTRRWIEEGRETALRSRQRVLELMTTPCDDDLRGVSDTQAQRGCAGAVSLGAAHRRDVDR